MQTDIPSQKELMDVDTFIDCYSISRSTFYAQVRGDLLKVIKIGRRTYISRTDATLWLKSIQENQPD